MLYVICGVHFAEQQVDPAVMLCHVCTHSACLLYDSMIKVSDWYSAMCQ